MLPRTLTFLVLCGFSCSFYTRYGVTRSNSHRVGLREDPELKELLTQAETLDAEWLQSVFGTSLVEQMKGDWQQQQQQQQPQPEEEKVDDMELKNAMAGLAQLGYNSEEMAMIKPSLRRVILEKQVMRPKDGLPEKWLLPQIPMPLSQAASSRRRPKGVQADEPFPERQVQRSSSINGVKKEGGGATRRERTREGEGEAFSWRGNVVPPTDDELRQVGQYARTRSSGSRSDVSSSSSSSRERTMRKTPPPLKSTSQRGKYGEEEEEDNEEGPANFWPDKEEFKDLLLEESEWRVDLLGNWIAPMVREETKWRYDLYKAWLGFLDEGLGDGFDIVSEDFGQGYRDMDMVMQRSRPRRYEAYEADEEEGEEFWEEDEDNDDDEEEEEERAYNDDARDRSRKRETFYTPPPAPPSFSSQSTKVPPRRSAVDGTGKLRQKKAAAYKERIESAIGETVPEGWTSVEEEERLAERMKRYSSRAQGGGYYQKDPLSDRDAWFGEDANDGREDENFQDFQESRKRSSGEVREDWEEREKSDRDRNNDWWDNAPDYSAPSSPPYTSSRRLVGEGAVVSPSRSSRGEFSPNAPYRRTSRQRGDSTRRSSSSSENSIGNTSSSSGRETNEGEEAQSEVEFLASERARQEEEEFRKAWEISKNRRPVEEE